MDLSLFLITFGGGALVGLLWAGVFVIRRGARFRREFAAATAGTYPPGEAYRRLVATMAQGMVRAQSLRLGLLLLLVLIIVVGQAVFITLNNTNPIAILQLLGGVMVGVGAAFLVGRLVYDALTAGMDRRVLVELRGVTIPPGLFGAARLRRTLILNLPVFVSLIALGVLIANATGNVTQIGIELVIVVVVMLTVVLLAQALNSWITPTLPVEGTPWAAFGERAAAWARTAGMAPMPVRVFYAVGPGAANILLTGLGRPTILVSDLFLARSDWRQQDAMLGYILGARRMGTARQGLSIIVGFLAAVLVVFVGALLALNALQANLDANTPASLPLLFVITIAPPALILLLLISMIVRVNRRAKMRLAPDRFAAALTGDPLAQIVAIHTMNALNGLAEVPAIQRSTIGRVAALDALARSVMPRAAWASAAVPSIAPVAIGPYGITTPLEQASPPQPVPASPVAPLPAK